jgi:hypothetical protein
MTPTYQRLRSQLKLLSNLGSALSQLATAATQITARVPRTSADHETVGLALLGDHIAFAAENAIAKLPAVQAQLQSALSKHLKRATGRLFTLSQITQAMTRTRFGAWRGSSMTHAAFTKFRHQTPDSYLRDAGYLVTPSRIKAYCLTRNACTCSLQRIVVLSFPGHVAVARWELKQDQTGYTPAGSGGIFTDLPTMAALTGFGT